MTIRYTKNCRKKSMNYRRPLLIFFDNPSPEHWHHVIEEAADVHIMLEQFQMLITPDDKKEFDKICMDKLHREIKRIEKREGKNGLSK